MVFLLRRAKLITKDISNDNLPEELQTQALGIVKKLDGLPLALDQAGAYIEETQCGLAGYLELYRTHGVDLLKERGLLVPGHPDPVATTWVLSFQKIEQANPAAAELLRFCAFLHSDGIPEELFLEGASELGPVLGPVAENPISFNRALGEILKFSLIHRDMKTKTLDIHRMVQSVILKSLGGEAHQQWVERLIRTMNCVFPEVEFKNWPKLDRFLTHAQQCASLIMFRELQLEEGTRLLTLTANYLFERGRYGDSKPLYHRAFQICEAALGPNHPDVATSLNNLAAVYGNQGRYAEAEPLYKRALSIVEQALGLEHPKTQTVRKNYKDLLKKMEDEKD